MANRLLPFLIENRGVRGFAVEITEGIPDLLGWRQYPPDVLRLLGHVLAATPLLAADLRNETRLNLQFQGSAQAAAAPLKLLVSQIDQNLQLRGMAKFEPGAEGDFQALMGGGTLACLIEPRSGGERYQALVEVLGDSLSEALEIYYAQSEQLRSLVRLGAAPDRFVGLMLQRLPENSSDDDWVHVYHLAQTLHEPELLATEAEVLLRRLFAEDRVRVFEPRPIQLQCQCSHAQISAMLLGLGEDELKPLLVERGRVDVTCEFCGKEYGYREVEVRELFAAAQAQAAEHRLQ
ncbi:MAG: Hsp33 family molecular chaperone HslO [Stagnimonas sp.]|nr:Hsp33 family molecular chaperone HslO [Stagnimonas sp.]